MRKRELNGRINTLVHNVTQDFHLFLKVEETIMEQIKALGLENELVKVSYKYNIEFEINGKKYIPKNYSSGTLIGKQEVFEK